MSYAGSMSALLLTCPKLTAACWADALKMTTVRYSVSSSRVFTDFGNSAGCGNRIDRIDRVTRNLFCFFAYFLYCGGTYVAQRSSVEMQEGCSNTGDTLTSLGLVVQSSRMHLCDGRQMWFSEVSPCAPTTLVKVLHAEAAGVFDKALDLLVLLHHFIIGVVDIHHVGHEAEEEERRTVDTCTGNERRARLTALHLVIPVLQTQKGPFSNSDGYRTLLISRPGFVII